MPFGHLFCRRWPSLCNWQQYTQGRHVVYGNRQPSDIYAQLVHVLYTAREIKYIGATLVPAISFINMFIHHEGS